MGVKGGGRGGGAAGPTPSPLQGLAQLAIRAHCQLRAVGTGGRGRRNRCAPARAPPSRACCCTRGCTGGQTPTATACSLCNALKPAPNPRTRPPSIGAKADAGGFAAPTPVCLHHTTNAHVPPSAHTVKIRNSWPFCTASHIVITLTTRMHRYCTMNPLSACMIGPAVGCTSEKVL